MIFRSAISIAVLIISGGASAAEPTQNEAASAENIHQAAVSSELRSEADLARDAGRKPAEVMAFFGIEPGMNVLDMFSGGGYYTELLANVVGPEGSVTAHSNKAYLSFSGQESAARYGDDRLPNTTVMMAENNRLSLQADRYDAVTMILAYHDVYFEDEKIRWPLIDGPKLLAELHKGMKSGAVLGIVDHNAASGSPAETGGTTHRIDVAIVLRDLDAAGFVFEARSEILANPDDDYEKSVFDSAIRGKSDRFMLRYRKP